MKKTYIFILTHGQWGEALIKSTEMIVGTSISDIKAFSLMPEMPLDDYQSAIASSIQALPNHDFIFLVDILGGTPYQIAAYYTQISNAEALAGLNMDLLITILNLRNTFACKDLPTQVLRKYNTSNQYVIDLKELLK